MVKECTLCKTVQNVGAFCKSSKSSDGFHSVCKNCDRLSKQAYYQKYKKQINQKQNIKRAEQLAWFRSLKAGLKCIRCGFDNPAALDFHHRDASQKLFTISGRVRSTSRENIIQEIAKCDVLCSNCHRIEHYDEVGLHT